MQSQFDGRIALGYIKVFVKEIPGYAKAHVQTTLTCGENNCSAVPERQIPFSLSVEGANFVIPVCMRHASSASAQQSRDSGADAVAKTRAT